MTSHHSVRNTRKHRRTMTLEQMESRQLLASFYVTNTGDSGTGTLRDAINNVNATPGINTIFFQLAQNALVIRPNTALPAITQSNTTLDAESQQPGYIGKPLVTLNGAATQGSSIGLDIQGGNTTVLGMVIVNWGSSGIKLEQSGGDTVQGCYIGVDGTGNRAASNGDGIYITNSNNTIGGTTSQTRNVISGNTFDQVTLTTAGFSNSSGNIFLGNYMGVGADGKTPLGALYGMSITGASGVQIGGAVAGAGNVISANNVGISILGSRGSSTIAGNFIGTDATGKIAVGNVFDGIDIVGAPNNTIGALGANGRNIISGNGGHGILLEGASAKNEHVLNNYIGVQRDGVSPLGNRYDGILINGSLGDTIGGDPATYGNIIANNGINPLLSQGYGIDIFSGSAVTMLSNSIYNNGSGGIHISKGSNGDLTPPTLASVQSGAGQTNIMGSILAASNSNYAVQFFSSPKGDPSGFGQGQVYLGETAVTTDANGNGSINVRLPVGVTVGNIVTSTLTELASLNTSSFSQNLNVTPAPVTNVQVSITPNPTTALLGSIEAYTVTVTNKGPNNATGVAVVNQFDTNSTVLDTLANPLPSNSAIDPQNPLNVNTTIGNLAKNASVSYTIYVTPNNVGQISLTSVESNQEINSNTNPTATSLITVSPAVNLSVGLIATPDPVAVGSPVNETFSITNNGPSPATNIQATLVIPANATLDFNSIQQSQGDLTLSADGKTIFFSAGNLQVNGTATLSVNLIPAGVGTIVVIGSASPTEALLDPTDPTKPTVVTTSLTTNVDYSADLGVAFVPTPTTAVINKPLVFVVTVSNGGPSDATGAFLTDTLPAGLTNISAVPSQGPAPTITTDPTTGITTITDALGAIANGGSATLTITATPTTFAPITNTAVVTNTTANELDAKPENNTTSTPVVQVSPVALNIGVSANPEPVFIGDSLVYVVDIKNTGPADATNVAISDLIDPSLTVNSIVTSDNGTAVNNGGLITYTFGSIPIGGDATLTISVTPTKSANLVNTARLISQDQQNTGSTLVATAKSTVSPADLNVAITSTNATPIIGNQVTYTVNFGNSGPATATNFLLTLPLPAGLTINSLFATVGSTPVSASIDPTTNILTLPIASFASGATGTLTLTVTPTVAESANLVATVTSDNVDPNNADNSAATPANIIALPGTFNFDSPTYSVLETGGSIVITVTRTNGISGDVVMSYTTQDGTAKAGVNYAYTAGTIAFPAGVTTAKITVPVVHDGQITPNLNFQVVLTGSSSGGGLIGTVGTATVTVVNVDRDTISPQVSSIQPVFGKNTFTGFNIAFTKPLDAASAGNPANYAIFLSGRDTGKPNVPFQIASAVYNPSTFVVTLTPVVPLALGASYGVAINGSTPSGVKDLSGNLLSGNGTGTPSDYNTYIAYGTNLTYIDASNNTVKIKITGGGAILLTRFANGSANTIQLIGINPRRTSLTGSVTHPAPRGKRATPGTTVVNSIVGLGRFGDVRSTLTTPGFYVVNRPVVLPSIVAHVPAGPIKHAIVKKK